MPEDEVVTPEMVLADITMFEAGTEEVITIPTGKGEPDVLGEAVALMGPIKFWLTVAFFVPVANQIPTTLLASDVLAILATKLLETVTPSTPCTYTPVERIEFVPVEDKSFPIIWVPDPLDACTTPLIKMPIKALCMRLF